MGNYQGYQKYKDSGVEWLGEIPEHWEVIRIKFSTYVKGRVGWHGLNSKEFLYEGDFYLVTGTDFKNRTVNWESCYRITEERYEEDPYIHLQEKDILITKDGTIGKVVQVKNIPYKASVNSGVFVTRPLKNKHYKDDYMFYVLASNIFHEFINLQKSGTTISHLYQNVFENFQYPFPPLDEQEKIAQFLDYKTKQIDELIKKKETLIEKLDEKRTALISHAVTKGLDSSVPMKDSGIEWLGNIPKHWTILKLGRLCDVTKLTGFEYTKKWETDPNGEIIALRGFNIKNNQLILNDVERITSELSNELLRSKLYAGDIVFPCTGTLGEGAIIDDDNKYHINQNIAKISPVKNIDRKFLLLSLCSKNMKYQIELYNSSGLQPVLLIGTIRSLIISIPDFLEQKQIAQYLDKKTAQIDLQKAKIKQAIELLKEYRTSLITNAVTGKIDVSQIAIPSPQKPQPQKG
jgi:type I restriction enzyme S subunit